MQHQYGGAAFRVHLTDPTAEKWYDVDWPRLAEIDLLKKHRLTAGATVFDIGAHQGIVALMLAQLVGGGGRIIAVEANQHNADVAQRNALANQAGQVAVVEAAVARTAGEIVFNQGLWNGQVDDGRGEKGGTKVRAVTVDALANEYGQPDVLYIDVEGYECEVLAGAANVLSNRPDCFVEAHVGIGLENLGGSVGRLESFFPKEHYTLYMKPDQADRDWEPFSTDSAVTHERFFIVAIARTAGA